MNKPKKPNKKPEQLQLEIKQTRLEGYYRMKNTLNRVETTVEALPYWKSFITAGSFFIGLCLVGLSGFLVIYFYDQLPPELPLIYSQNASTWQLISKETYLGVPLFLAGSLFILYRLNSLTFRFDRRLARTVNVGIIIFSILGLIAFSQLFALILIY